MAPAAQRADAAVEALDLKVLHDGPVVIDVRLAADPYCSLDPGSEEMTTGRLRPFGFRFLLGIMALLAGLTSGAVAADTQHLRPERSIFGFSLHDAYKLAVGRALLQEYQYRHCQVVFLASFENEAAVYILRPEEDQAGHATVVSVEMKTQLWYEMMRMLEEESDGASYSTGFEAQTRVLPKIPIEVHKLAAPIPLTAVDALEAVWDAMLLRARHPTETRILIDADAYHFANFKLGHGYWAGAIRSPTVGTPPHDLVDIAKALRAYPGLPPSERDQARAKMVAAAERLLSRLEKTSGE